MQEKDNIKRSSVIWVLMQFTTLSVLLATTPFKQAEPVSGLFIVSGLALGIWALIVMRGSRFRILPEPLADACLVTSGPYRYIRHPMYSALVLFSMGLLLIHLNTFRLLMAGLLFLVLHLKINREENLLRQKFAAYAEYCRQSKRLFPFIY
jgi:protein-S-isoprenylcysteine O-methyltransferase Ste14